MNTKYTLTIDEKLKEKIQKKGEKKGLTSFSQCMTYYAVKGVNLEEREESGKRNFEERTK